MSWTDISDNGSDARNNSCSEITIELWSLVISLTIASLARHACGDGLIVPVDFLGDLRTGFLFLLPIVWSDQGSKCTLPLEGLYIRCQLITARWPHLPLYIDSFFHCFNDVLTKWRFLIWKRYYVVHGSLHCHCGVVLRLIVPGPCILQFNCLATE